MKTCLLQICCAVLLSIKSINAVHANDCDAFFHSATKYPYIRSYQDTTHLVKLCQNEETAAGDQDAVFATLYDYNVKCPLYSASKLNLRSGMPIYPSPNSVDKMALWKRFASALCVDGAIAVGPTLSKIKEITDAATKVRCKQRQPSFASYSGNGLGLTKGHLEPRSTQSSTQVKSETTYTLTNVAPQYNDFNSGSWKKLECLTKQLIINLAPNQDVYVVTGVSGHKKTRRLVKVELPGGIRVPNKFWKSVCYPGHWAFHLSLDNTNVIGPSTKETVLPLFKNIKISLHNLFEAGKTPFGDACINQPHDPVIAELNNNWSTHNYNTVCEF